MMQTLVKRWWWLLALCGLLDALFCVMILSMQSAGRSTVMRSLMQSKDEIALMGLVAFAAGACTIGAGVWSSRERGSWLLVLNGLACGALGLLMIVGATRPVTFRTVAIAVAVMAASIGMYEFVTARRFRGRVADERLLGVAGVISLGFALGFFAFVVRWIALDPSPSAQTFHWLGSYFGFSAICMVGLGLLSRSVAG
jgi:hypothetical protein